mmetsp:Transcript_7519/g.8114  ORF Transcript_7519/g.8114 Transcript_7519/m.8114 type:complete len:1045 (+) Transcript_7519:154-3288(+)
MTSESEMPLQVSHASILLPTPSIDNNIKRSTNTCRINNNTATSVVSSRSFGFDAVGEGCSTSIVRGPVQKIAQNTELNCVLDSTAGFHDESRHNFTERKITSDTTIPYLRSQQQQQQQQQTKPSLSHQIENIKGQQLDKTIKHTEIYGDVISSDLSLSSTSTEFVTITRQESTSNPVEKEENRERYLNSQIIEKSDNKSYKSKTRQSPFESIYLKQHHQQQQQQKNSLATLQQQHPQPPVQHTVTAAEIALGISTSYGQNLTMGDGSRSHSVISYVDHHRDSKRDMIISQRKETEETSRSSTGSITVMSPGRMTPIHDLLSDHGTQHHQNIGIMIGTPSTVSTAPSSDDEALVDYKLDETSALPNLLHPIHPGVDTMREEVLLSSNDSVSNQNPWIQSSLPANPSHAQQRSWDGVTPLNTNQHPLEQRVATFRNERFLFAQQQEHQQNHHDHHVAKSQLTQQLLYLSPKKEPYSPQHSTYHQQHHHHQQELQISPRPTNRKLSYVHHATHTNPTPLRSGRNQRQQGNNNSRQVPLGGQGSSPTISSSQRSPSEILKTLLRKKACLYESGTSRSVALVTWFVGRVLALEHGFFSRQQLQSGVHACVAKKIESGTITRTKVNRCMQIILNSCFHYIIPRSDGTEEKGDYFRDIFSETVQDDSLLLKQLPEPWNDLTVDKNVVIDAILNESEEKLQHQRVSNTSRSPSTSPKSSPKFGSINAEKTPDRCQSDREKEEESKRAVLLCFNENVRSAEDVFCCHNDFIRDTANAAHLQLTAHEWCQFFGRETFWSPHLWDNAGIPTVLGESLGGPPRQSDLLGQMSPDELGKFRSTWCTKRYDHDHDLCGFAHIEINDGWLRRNPVTSSYKNEMCNFISIAGDKMISPTQFYLNECPKGIACDYAHSMEEIMYHPMNYKAKLCTSMYSRSGGCRFGDICPNVHPSDTNRPFKTSSDGRSPTGNRGKKKIDQGKSITRPWFSTTLGSPVVYASPAPFSRFERQLVLPGLQNLYRRQSEVIRAYIRSSGNYQCSYSLFGNNCEISFPDSVLK